MTDQTTPEPEDNGDDVLGEAERIINDAAAATEDTVESATVDADADDVAKDIEAARQEAAAHLSDLQRLQAEYVNYRKRVDRDRDLASTTATVKVVEALIPVLDDIAGAREHGDLADGPFAAIAAKLEDSLGRFGWESFGAKGDVFDPMIHEALTSIVSTEVTEPTVEQVAQPGHRIGDKVVRPARVIVAQPE